MALKWATAFLALSTSVLAQNNVNYFFTLGDSYTDSSFKIDGEKPSAANPQGNPAYPGRSLAGGLNWNGHLIYNYNRSSTYIFNLAVGGATVDNTIIQANPNDLVTQMKIFSDKLAKKPAYAPWKTENTIAAVWMGINDVGGVIGRSDMKSKLDMATKRYFELSQTLYNAGIRKIIFLTVPPMNRAPGNNWTDERRKLHAETVATYNNFLSSRFKTFESKNSGLRTRLIDTSKSFNEALDNPTDYGAPNNMCHNNDGKSCLWHDTYHPGQAIHDLVAAQVAADWDSDIFQCMDSTMCKGE